MPLDLKTIEQECQFMTALPSNRIKGFNYAVGADGNDTAFYHFKDQRITLTDRLVRNIEAAVPTKADAAVKAVLYHEAGHSIITRYWPEKATPTQSAIMNWLEDYRLNQWLLSGNPDLRDGFAACYKAVAHGREPRPGQRQVPEEVTGFLSELSTRSPNGEVRVQFEYMMAATLLSPQAKAALRDIQPDVVEFVNKTPDAYDVPLTNRVSLESLQVAERIFKKLDRIFAFEQEAQAQNSAGSPSDLLDAVNKELKKRGGSQPGQSGQPQPGAAGPGQPGPQGPGVPPTLAKMTKGQLEALKRALEALEEMPNNGNPDAQKIKSEAISSEIQKHEDAEHSQANAKASTVATDMVSVAEYSDFYCRHQRFIAEAERAFANTDHLLDPQGRTRLYNSYKGPIINPRNAARVVLSPQPSMPPLYQRPQEQELHGEKEWKLDKLYFVVDGSGSMAKRLPFVTFFLGVVYEAARKAKIPAAIVVAYGGRPHVISTGGAQDRPADVIKRILAIRASGGTNVSEGALQEMFKLGGVAKATTGRLTLITDCETSPADLQLMNKWSTQLRYPAALIGVGSAGYISSAAASFKTGPVIGYDQIGILQSTSRFMSEFALWMREPRAYHEKYPPGRARLFSEFRNEPISRGFSAGMDL